MSLHPELGFFEKIRVINKSFVFLVIMTAMIGVGLLYSASGGSWDPWALSHLIKFLFSLSAMMFVAFLPIRWLAHGAYFVYLLVLILLIIVEIKGHIGMGAQRWINFGFIALQPSELMKIALILALARYFHNLNAYQTGLMKHLIMPGIMIAFPVALVLIQPNLGTALLLIGTAVVVLFGAGIQMWKFVSVGISGLIAIPFMWQFFLKEYQKKRILTFLNPDSDPLGAGYNIIQSKIALGSGGFFGKGFTHGSQGQLMFLPEKHTDFIFVLLAEEFGMLGCLFVMGLLISIISYGMVQAMTSRNQFGRLVALGVGMSFFFYLFVNIGMVSGLMPVVGIPIPLISFGGTAMLTYMIGCGLLMNVSINRDIKLEKM